MRAIFIFLCIGFSTTVFSQDYNIQDGYVAGGYDVVAYFNNKAIEGNKKFTTSYEGARFKFSSQENLNTFKKEPSKYLPQYGGYCAYALGKNGKKVSIDPETFEIHDGKLYLFYNSWLNNTYTKWKKEGAEKLRTQADNNWKKIKNN